jgi:hypothetical protein
VRKRDEKGRRGTQRDAEGRRGSRVVKTEFASYEVLLKKDIMDYVRLLSTEALGRVLGQKAIR